MVFRGPPNGLHSSQGLAVLSDEKILSWMPGSQVRLWLPGYPSARNQPSKSCPAQPAAAADPTFSDRLPDYTQGVRLLFVCTIHIGLIVKGD